MKHICLFSGGAGSSYMSWLVAQEYPKDTILLFNNTKLEHPDSDRFRKQVANYIGLPITEANDGRDLWQLIDNEHCLPSSFIPFCSRILKQAPAEKYYKTLIEDYTLYIGYDISEGRRIQRQTARIEHDGRKVKYPLMEQGISSDAAKDIIKNEWKICLPETYKYLRHNNCIPCFKGGVGHFKRVWRYYPKEFQMAIDKENLIGATVFKEKSLTAYAKDWQKELDQNIDLFTDKELDDNVPCLCAL